MIVLGGNRKITIPRGDTGNITAAFTTPEGVSVEGGTAIFAIRSRSGRTVLRKEAAITDGSAVFRIACADTRGLSVSDKYNWDIRVVTDPGTDADGNATADDATDDVHSLFSAGGMPELEITEVAADV